ncbi:MAG: cupin domain-containing protein [Planctomycetota bacterium]
MSIRRHARLAALLLLSALGGCDTLFYGFSIIQPEEPPRPPMIVDTREMLQHPPVGDPAVMPLLAGTPRSSVSLVTVKDRTRPLYHHHSDKTLYILEGHGDMLLDQEWQPVQAGMLIHIPMNVPYSYVNRAEGGTVMLSTFTPAYVEGDEVEVQEARRR